MSKIKAVVLNTPFLQEKDWVRRRALQHEVDQKISRLYGCFMGVFLPGIPLEGVERIAAALPDINALIRAEEAKAQK